MSDGEQIYNGKCDQSMKGYFKKFGVIMPKYVNPADFLIKLAIDSKIVDKRLKHSELVKKC